VVPIGGDIFSQRLYLLEKQCPQGNFFDTPENAPNPVEKFIYVLKRETYQTSIDLTK
jgi:hypothetical protein